MRELLRNGSFVRLFVGRVVTNAGDSLYYVATMWLVYQLTGSATYTGIAGFLSMAPSTVQFLFGPLVDRLPLRRVLVGTQLVQGVLVLVVPLAAAFDALSVWVLLTVIPILSLLNQPVYPAETAALPRIVENDELVEANSLFSFAYQGVDAAFNAVGGVLVAALGAVTLFLVDSLTFGATTLLFVTLSIPAADASDDAEKRSWNRPVVPDRRIPIPVIRRTPSPTEVVRPMLEWRSPPRRISLTSPRASSSCAALWLQNSSSVWWS